MIYFIMFTTSKKNIYKKAKKFSKKIKPAKKIAKNYYPYLITPLTVPNTQKKIYCTKFVCTISYLHL